MDIKKLTMIRIEIICFLSILLCVSCQHQATVYIDSNATEGKQNTFKTFEEARDAVRKGRANGKYGEKEQVTVLINPGNYPIKKSICFSPKDSYTTYQAKEQGTVLLSGGIQIFSDSFHKVTDPKIKTHLKKGFADKILVSDISALFPDSIKNLPDSYIKKPTAPWLYMDGEPMKIARWPNKNAPEGEWATFSKAVDNGLPVKDAKDPKQRVLHPGSFIYDKGLPENWSISEGVWLNGYWTHDWHNATIRISSYNKKKKIVTLAAPDYYGIASETWGANLRRFYALNLLEELDAPEEWYLDRTKKMLYFYPGLSLKDKSVILVAMNAPLIKMDSVTNMKFEGVNFAYTMGDGFSAREITGTEINGCIITDCGGYGIQITGNHNTVNTCDLFNIGQGGINIEGGDRKQLVKSGNLIVNNHIHDFACFQRVYAPGIRCNGCGNIIKNNCIHDTPHIAILSGGNEHLIAYNEIYRTDMDAGDAGAFYSGRNWGSRGNVIKYNYFHDLGNEKEPRIMAIYLDDCDSGDSIIGNIINKSGYGILIGGGRDNPCLNNIIMNCRIGYQLDVRGLIWDMEKKGKWNMHKKISDMGYDKDPWKTQYPHLAKIMDEAPWEARYNDFINNVIIDCKAATTFTDTMNCRMMEYAKIENNLVVNTKGEKDLSKDVPDNPGYRQIEGNAAQPIDLGFKDIEKGDFSLKEDSLLLKEIPGFQKIPFEKIGLYNNQWRKKIN